MFYGLTANQTFWEERLNLFVAIAPVTKIYGFPSILRPFIKYGSPYLKVVCDMFHIYSLNDIIA